MASGPYGPTGLFHCCGSQMGGGGFVVWCSVVWCGVVWCGEMYRGVVVMVVAFTGGALPLAFQARTVGTAAPRATLTTALAVVATSTALAVDRVSICMTACELVRGLMRGRVGCLGAAPISSLCLQAA
jgi:hypothetical protein